MFIRELGAGPAVVVLLHGAPSPAEDFNDLANELAHRYRVLVPDLPGYGQSPAGDLSYAAVNQRLRDELAARSIDRVHALVGFSGGVLRALYLMLRAGLDCGVLVSLAGLAGLDAEGRAAMKGFADLARADPAILSSPAMLELMGNRMLSPAWRARHPEDVARVAAWCRLMTPRDLADELDATSTAEDLHPELANVSARIYARVGELDQACPLVLSQALVHGVASARLDVVPGCGHALLIEDAAATQRAVVQAIG